jgi:acyl carrier protein
VASNEDIKTQVIDCVTSALALAPGAEPLTEHTELLGNLPEFDSQSVITILTAIEDEFEFIIEDDEVDASLFESIGSLINFVVGKTQQAIEQ